jgi:hypothetical protein
LDHRCWQLDYSGRLARRRFDNAAVDERTQWDADRKIFQRKPLHDWTSHAADAFAYLAMMLDNGGDPASHRKLV